MEEPEHSLVREVSRSFSITLRLLPDGMREPVSLAYLLARASDTIADTAEVPRGERVALLDGFVSELGGGGGNWRGDLSGFAAHQTHAGERRLMARLGECFGMLERLPDGQRVIVREVVETITGGQKLDLERFAGGGVMPDAKGLEDYCWRVAGCVGAFWTKIGFETLGERFSKADPGELECLGINYGKGLQLVNILRDLPTDLANGRCYLPVADPTEREELMAEAAAWRARSRQWLGDGLDYSRKLRIRRLRVASDLPALIGERTLDLLDGAGWDELANGVKVSRSQVRWCIARALFR